MTRNKPCNLTQGRKFWFFRQILAKTSKKRPFWAFFIDYVKIICYNDYTEFKFKEIFIYGENCSRHS